MADETEQRRLLLLARDTARGAITYCESLDDEARRQMQKDKSYIRLQDEQPYAMLSKPLQPAPSTSVPATEPSIEPEPSSEPEATATSRLEEEPSAPGAQAPSGAPDGEQPSALGSSAAVAAHGAATGKAPARWMGARQPKPATWRALPSEPRGADAAACSAAQAEPDQSAQAPAEAPTTVDPEPMAALPSAVAGAIAVAEALASSGMPALAELAPDAPLGEMAEIGAPEVVVADETAADELAARNDDWEEGTQAASSQVAEAANATDLGPGSSDDQPVEPTQPAADALAEATQAVGAEVVGDTRGGGELEVVQGEAVTADEDGAGEEEGAAARAEAPTRALATSAAVAIEPSAAEATVAETTVAETSSADLSVAAAGDVGEILAVGDVPEVVEVEPTASRAAEHVTTAAASAGAAPAEVTQVAAVEQPLEPRVEASAEAEVAEMPAAAAVPPSQELAEVISSAAADADSGLLPDVRAEHTAGMPQAAAAEDIAASPEAPIGALETARANEGSTSVTQPAVEPQALSKTEKGAKATKKQKAPPAAADPEARPPPDDPRFGTPWETKESAAKTIGKRVQVWWDGDNQFFKGEIISAGKGGRVRIHYDDNQKKWHWMCDERYTFIDHLKAVNVNGDSEDDTDEDDVPLAKSLPLHSAAGEHSAHAPSASLGPTATGAQAPAVQSATASDGPKPPATKPTTPQVEPPKPKPTSGKAPATSTVVEEAPAVQGVTASDALRPPATKPTTPQVEPPKPKPTSGKAPATSTVVEEAPAVQGVTASDALRPPATKPTAPRGELPKPKPTAPPAAPPVVAPPSPLKTREEIAPAIAALVRGCNKAPATSSGAAPTQVQAPLHACDAMGTKGDASSSGARSTAGPVDRKAADAKVAKETVQIGKNAKAKAVDAAQPQDPVRAEAEEVVAEAWGEEEVSLKHVVDVTLELEESVPMEHVNQEFQRQLKKWRKEVGACQALGPLKALLRRLKLGMLDSEKVSGRATRIFRKGWARDEPHHIEWMRGMHRAETPRGCLLLVQQLYFSRTADDEPTEAGDAPARAVPDTSSPNQRQTQPSTKAKGGSSLDTSSPNQRQTQPSTKAKGGSSSNGSQHAPIQLEDSEGAAEDDSSEDEVAEVAPPAAAAKAKVKASPRQERAGDAKRKKVVRFKQPPRERDESDDDSDQLVDEKPGDSDHSLLVEEGPSSAARAPLRRLAKSNQVGGALQSLGAGIPPPWNELAVAKRQIGRQVRVFWGGNHRWFQGRIVRINEVRHTALIHYEDNENKWHAMWEEVYEFVDDDEDEPLRMRKKRARTAAEGRTSKAAKTSRQERKAQALDSPSGARATSASRSTATAGRRGESPAKHGVEENSQGSQGSQRGSQRADEPKGETACMYKLPSAPQWVDDGAPCSCEYEFQRPLTIRESCKSYRCDNYEYYDALRIYAGERGPSSRMANVTFHVNDGLVCRDAEEDSNAHLFARFAGARQNKHDGRIECLCQWFVKASDHQVAPWPRTVLGSANIKHFPEPPANLVYRVGGVEYREHVCDWSRAELTILARCRIEQASSRDILRLCQHAMKKGYAQSIYYYDSVAPVIAAQETLGDPVQLSGSALQQASAAITAEGDSSDEDENGARELAPQKAERRLHPKAGTSLQSSSRYRIKKRATMQAASVVDLEPEKTRPAKRRSNDRALGLGMPIEELAHAPWADTARKHMLCGECVQSRGEPGQYLTCEGGCLHSFHHHCAGIQNSFNKGMLAAMMAGGEIFTCTQCRMGKATCTACRSEGFLNSEASGLVRCSMPNCGRAYHRNCLADLGVATELTSAGGLVFECPVHCCYLCGQSETSDRNRKGLDMCWMCPKAFCNRNTCRPQQMRRLEGSRYILCDTACPNHNLDERASAGARMRADQTSPLDDARSGTLWQHLVVPEATDDFAGPFYQAGVAMGARASRRMASFASRIGGPGAAAVVAATACRDAPSPTCSQLRQLPSSRSARGMSKEERDGQDEAAAAIRNGDIPWGLASLPVHLRGGTTSANLTSIVVPRETRGSGDTVSAAGTSLPKGAELHDYRVRIKHPPERELDRHIGRFYPLILTREPKYEHAEQGLLPLRMPKVALPHLPAKLSEHVVKHTMGTQGVVHRLIARGLAIEPKLVDYDLSNIYINSHALAPKVSGGEVRDVVELIRSGKVAEEVVMQRVRGMFSSQRSYLNGLRVNRAKYTTFSRHFTFARVLRQIADCVQNELLPGDTFVDFACGQNSFGSLLKDPATNEPLPTIAFDILSPAERTDDFHRHPWHAVDASVLPPGELVIGLNPPFGHQNREAIEFVEHALYAARRPPRETALLDRAERFAHHAHLSESLVAG